MNRGPGERLPVPTEPEIKAALAEGREITACSGTRHGATVALNLAYRGGGIVTVVLGETGTVRLLAALKALSPDGEAVPPSHVSEGPLGKQVQEGHLTER